MHSRELKEGRAGKTGINWTRIYQLAMDQHRPVEKYGVAATTFKME
jgi:hypothetical protein